MAFTAGFGMLLAAARGNAQPPSANQIVPDGRTSTTLQALSSSTSISTGTIVGGNAYNSFSQFKVGAGNTVTLQVPDAAGHLVNLVTGSAVTVDGVLNSVRDGKIGGNVVFADPYGFIVGAQGTLNVGSLQATTPTPAFLDRLMDQHGTVDQAAAAQLLAGQAPLSPLGTVSIRGRVNAADGVAIQAHTVGIGRDALHRAKFAATVNTAGVQEAGGIVVSNGDIEIVAAGDAAVTGTLSANGAAGRAAGHVGVTAGHDLSVGGKARISAAGSGAGSAGGAVRLYASHDLSVASGAVLSAAAGSSGDGGQIEVSAGNVETIAGGTTFDVGATAGQAGGVTFDPATLVIGVDPSQSTSTVTDADSINSGGGNVTMSATSSIEIVGTGYINTRKVATGTSANDATNASIGNSGNITLTAPEITLDAGAKLLSFATDSYAAGNVLLDATGGTLNFPVDPNGLVSAEIATRVIASGTGADLVHSASTGASGDIELKATTFAFGNGINTAGGSGVAPGVQLLANSTLPDAAVAPDCVGICIPTAITAFVQGTITLDTPSLTLASGQQILTRGADLVINATGAVTLSAGSLINTRHLADTADPTDPATEVLDPSGSVDFNVGSFAAPAGMNVTGGAAVLAGGYGGGLGFAPGRITIAVPGALSVDDTLASAGANLLLLAPGGITLGSNAVLSTRQVAAGADPTDPTQASQNVSGRLSLVAASGNITVDAGAQLLTFSTDGYYGGAVLLNAGGTISFPTGTGTALIATRAITSGTGASLAGGVATADANDITLMAGSGISLPAGINTATGVQMLAGAGSFLPGTITLQTPSITLGTGQAIHTEGANLALDGTAAVTLSAGAEIDTRMVAQGGDPTSSATASIGPSGTVTIAGPTSIGAGADVLSFADSGFAAGAVSVTGSLAASGVYTIDAHAAGGGAAGSISLPLPSGGLASGINTATGPALLAEATGGGTPGTITITGGTFSIGGATELLTLGANLTLQSSGDLTLAAGSVISTRQIASGASVTDHTVASTGDSGDITLIAADSVSWPVGINVAGGPILLANGNSGYSSGTITIQEPFVPMGATGAVTIDTLGANLALTGTAGSAAASASQGVQLGSQGSIDTRQLNAAGTASIGDSGSVTLTGYGFGSSGFPGINTAGGASINTGADSGYAAGGLTVSYQIDNAVPVTFNGTIEAPGGDVTIAANTALTIGSSAVINLAGTRNVAFAAPGITIASGATIDAAAFSESADSFDITSANSIYQPGQNVTLTATGTITIESGGVISTRRTATANDATTTSTSTGSSGGITLTGSSITVDGLLDAAVVNTGGTQFSAGDVTLTASNTAASQTSIGGSYDATGSVTVAGTISGGNIALSNTSTATSTVSNSAAGIAEEAAAAIIANLLGGNVGVMLATAHSTVEITGTGHVTGTGNVSLDAIGDATASNSLTTTSILSLSRLAGTSNPIPLPAVTVGEVTDITKALIDSGATVSAGGLLSVRAHNTDTLSVSTSTISTNNTIDLAAAYSTTDVESTATIASGANVTAGSVRVVARNDNSWSTTASVSDMLQGSAGAVLALANGETSTATASENAGLSLQGSTAATGASLLVQAQSVNTLDIVSASASTGSGKMAGIIFGALNGGATYLTNSLGSATGVGSVDSALFNSNSTSTSKPRLAVAVSLTLNDVQTANALIGGDGGEPVITASGPVLADATVSDGGVRSLASSQVSSNSFATNSSQNPGTTYSISAAVAVGEYTHTADAEIGTQTTVTAPSVALVADTSLPLYLPITKWDSFTDVLDNLQTLVLGTVLGNQFNEFTTSGANATGDAQKLGGSGSVNYFQVQDNTTAWIGQGASVTVTPAAALSPTVALDTGDDTSNGLLNGTAASQSWTQAIDLSATNNDQAISLGGALNILGLLLGGASNKAATVGGSFDMNDFHTTTLAGIGADATIDTNGVLGVTTLSDDLIVSIVPASGRGGAIAVTGMVGLNYVVNITHSSISNAAAVDAAEVDLSATQTLFDLVEAGSIEQSNTATVGIGVALNVIHTDTQAYIGDNGADDPTAAVASGFVLPVAGIATASISVDAITDGQVIALGVGAAVASSSDPNAPQSGDDESASNGNQVSTLDDPVLDSAQGSNGQEVASTGDPVLDETTLSPGIGTAIQNGLGDAFEQVTNSPSEEPNQPSFGVGISGSVAINSAVLDTSATIDAATITYTSGGADSVQVEALRDTWLTTAAGAAAILHPNSTSSQTNVGVAGAAAVDLSASMTSASITGSHVAGFTDTTVQALTSGEQIVIGLDFSASGGGGDEGVTIGIAASVSVAVFTDRVSAEVADSTITGDGSSGGFLDVVAYDRTDIGIGAGSLYIKAGSGDGGGGGVALTYAQIGDPSSGAADEADITGSTVNQVDDVAVHATSADRIITGAAMISGGTNTNGLSGAVTVADITTTTKATITGSTINAGTSVAVTADGGDRSGLDALVAADGVPLGANGQPEASPIDFSGSEVLSSLSGSNTSSVGPGSDIIAVAGDLTLAFGENSKVNVGLTVVVNLVDQTDTATIADSSVITGGNGATGSVSVDADDQTMILGISAGAALATGGFAGLGSIAVNIVNNTATATVGDATATSNTTSVQSGSLTVEADNSSTTESFAGNITIATNGPAAGAAIGYSGTTETTTALAVLADLDIAGVTEIDAATTGTIESAAVAAAFAAGDNGVAFGGSATANVIGNTTSASTQDVSLNDPTVFTGTPAPSTGDTLEVLASDQSTIESLAGALVIGQQAGIGAAIAYNSTDNTISAEVLGDDGNGTTDPRIAARNVLVSAASDGTIETLGVGGGGGTVIAAAGSFAISDMTTTVTAAIDQAAIVAASDNVYVLASDNNSIQVLAGGLAVSAGGDVGAGIGFSEAFNFIGGTTKAYIGGNSTVDAAGSNPSDTCIATVCGVNDGTLLSAPDVADITAPSVSTFNLGEQQATISGLAVDATSDEQVIANAATLGVALNPEGSIGVGLNVVVNEMSGNTDAYIDGALIDTNLSANPAAAGYVAPAVFVNASSHAYTGDFVVALSGSIYVGASGVADATTIDRTTKAYVQNATIGTLVAATTSSVAPKPTDPADIPGCTSAQSDSCVDPFTLTTIMRTPAPSVGAFTVNAASTADSANIVIGLSAAGGAVTGTVVVNLFAPETDATIGAGTAVAAGSMTVTATTETGANVLAGAAALGGAAGSGAFSVLISSDTTNATVGDKTSETTPTTLAVAGALTVGATTTDDFNSLVISGALAGGVGLAGMANVDVITNATTAGLYLVTLGQTGAAGTPGPVLQDPNNPDNYTQTTDSTGSGMLLAPASSASVTAGETVNVGANAGALAVGFGGAGVGAGATAVVLKSNTTAETVDSDLTTSGTVGVDATSDKSIQASAVSIGAGSSAGIGGSAALILLGSGDTGTSSQELNANGSGTLSSVNSATTGGATSSAASSPGMSGTASSGLGTSYSVTDALNSSNDDAVTAAVQGGIITAAELDVHATSTVSTSNVTGGGGLSTGLGLGGAVSFTRIYDTVTASETQATVDAAAVSIKAVVQDGTLQLNGSAAGTASALSAAGAAGLVGLGAAVSDVLVDDHVTADAGGTLSGSGTLLVDAEDNSNATAAGYGAAAGAAAVGVVVVNTSKTSDVESYLLNSTSVIGYATTTISATQQGTLNATSVGAAGGLLGAGTGAASTATNLSTVKAYAGSDVLLPDGDLALSATNNATDITSSLGVAGGLYFAAGVAVSMSYSGEPGSDDTQAMVTSASLGDGDRTSATRSGALSLIAQGVDVNTATATAGAGGAVAGDASLAYTNDTAFTTVSLGAPALDGNNDPLPLEAGTVTLAATHVTNYGGMANSGNAAILGGSGAQAQNTAYVSTNATVANNADVVASGLVQIGTANNFVDTTSGDAAFGAAGGIANGAAALASTTITSGSAVTLGTGVSITSGTDPSTAPGGIALTAGVLAAAGDQVVLETGGALEGAVTQNDLTMTLNESVEVGINDTLHSQGSVGAGTYAQVTSSDPQAYASTYGLAVVGTAKVTVTVTVTQSVSVDAGAQMIGFGNVTASAGTDPTGSYQTVLESNPSAQAYARGIIGVPVVSDSDNITSNASVTIAGPGQVTVTLPDGSSLTETVSGALLRSAQNVVIAAAPGTPSTNPTATGTGYEVGFIPVDVGSPSTTTSTSSTVTIGGTAEAGYYAHLAIDIPGCANSAAFCGDAVQSSGLPASLLFNPSENLIPVIVQYWTDLESQTSIESGIAGGPVGTYTIGTLFAAGGEVTIDAGTISGTGTVSAQGAPSITVTNESPDYLVFGQILIPGQPGGAVIFTGAAGLAQAQAAGITVSQTGDATPQINISSTYGRTVDSTDPTVAASAYGPGMLFTGAIETVTGSININNTLGSISLPGEVIGEIINIVAPNGVSTVGSAITPVTYLLADPYAQWNGYMIWPGGNPTTGAPNAALAIAYVANSQYGGLASAYGLSISDETIGQVNGSSTQPAGASGSTVFYGDCLAASGFGDCGQSTAQSNSPSGQAFAIDPDGGPNYYYFSVIPQETLSTSVQVTPATTNFTAPSSSSVLGRQVLVEGLYIDVSGTITSGQTTSWSAVLPGTLDATLAADQAAYNSGRQASPLFNLPVSTINSSDAPVTAQYDAATGQIVLQDVYAASGSGSVKLIGGIIGTSSYANIHVNTGLGDVTVTNDTDAPLTVQDVNVGSATANSALVSTVEIIDTLKPVGNTSNPDHYFYQYTSGQGLEIRSATSPDTTFADATLVQAATPGSNSTSYAPVTGTRFQWVEEANLSRPLNETVNSSNQLTSFSLGGWVFDSITTPDGTANTNNPWVYVAPGGGLTTLPTGQVLFNQGEGPAFEETVTGSSGGTASVGVTYHGCDGTTCHYGFPAYGAGANGVADGSTWTYSFPTTATLTLTASVRADDPIGITFSGSTTGSISVTSDTPVTIAGKLFNPSGTTTIAAAASPGQASIIEGPTASITAANLTLSGTTGIGTASDTLNATLTQATQGGPYGTLNATAGSGGIYLTLGSGATLGAISARDSSGYGDVSITAAFDLLAGNNGSVTGRDITLISSTGAIGASGQPVQLAPNGQGGNSGGVVTLSALNDIDIELDSGNLLASSITSTGGSVSIRLDAGAVLDAAATTPVQALSSQQLAAIQATLQLTALNGAATAATNDTVNPLNTLLENAYQKYWSLQTDLLPNGSVSQGVFTLSTTGLTAFRLLAAQNLGINPSVITDAQVQTYANNLYQQIPDKLAPLFAAYFGTDWQSLSDFQSQNANFTLFDRTGNGQAAQTYVSATLQADATWTLAQLENAVSYTALQPLSSGVVGIGTPQITGHSVSITRSEAVGTLAQPVFIALADLLGGTLQPAQSAALALASAPGQVQFTATDSSGNQITLPITELLQQNGSDFLHITGQADMPITLTGISIAQTAPLFVDASNNLDIDTSGAVYVQSTLPTLTLGLVQAGGNVSLTAPDSIVSGLMAGARNIAVADGGVTLLAGTGRIGSATAPVVFSVGTPGATGALASASAGTDLYLDHIGSNDLTLGAVFAGNAAVLSATQGIQAAVTGLNVKATDITLTANDGDIGRATHALQVQVASGGLVDAGATQGAIYLYGPTGSVPTPLAIGTLTAGTLISLGSADALTAVSLTAGSGGISASAGAAGTFTSVTTSGPILLTAATGLTVGTVDGTGAGQPVALDAGAAGTVTIVDSVASGGTLTINGGALSMDTGATLTASGAVDATLGGSATIGAVTSLLDADQAVTITAGTGGAGGIFSNGDAAGVIATAADARVYLTAAGDIGTSAAPLPVDVTWLQADSTGGSIDLTSDTSLHAASLSAAQGAVAVTSTGGDLTLDSITARGTIDAQAHGALTIGSATSGGTQTMDADGAVSFTTLTTTATGDTDVTSTDRGVAGGTILAAGAVSLSGQGDVTGSSIDAGGAIVLTGLDLGWTALTAGTTIATTAGGTLTLGTATSVGTQTLDAVGDIVFTALQTTAAGGDVLATSSAGGIAGGAVAAFRDATLQAETAVTGSTITTGGAISLTAETGAIDWTTLTAGTTIDATAGGTLTLGTATSLGTQTLTAAGNLGFTLLQTTGTGGDLDARSTGGALAGGAVEAFADATLRADGAATGSTITAGGAIALTSDTGAIGWTTLTAGTTISADAGTTMTLGTATSAGSQTLTSAGALGFTLLHTTAAGGDVDARSTGGAVAGGAVEAFADATLRAHGALTGSTVTAGDAIALTADTGAIGWTTLTAGTTIDATAGTTMTLGTATSGGSQTLTSAGNLDFTLLHTTDIGGDVDARSTGGAIAGGAVEAFADATVRADGAVTGSTVTAGGAISLTADTGAIGWTTLTAGTTISADAGGVLSLGSAGSVGAQMLTAAGNVGFGKLTSTGAGGDIDVTSTAGGIGNGTVTASGDAVLHGHNTVAGSSITAADAVELTSDIATINWATVTAGTTIDATAGGALTLGNATSAGTQTLAAAGAVGFTQLQTTATGDIDARSTGGALAGGTVLAAGNASLAAAGDDTGKAITAGGAVTLGAGGAVNWATLSAGTTIGATAGGALTLGTATSAGSQTLAAGGALGFTQLTTTGTGTEPGNIAATSSGGSIAGGDVTAAGSASLTAAGDNTGDTIGAGGAGDTIGAGGAIALAAGGVIDWTTLGAGGALTANAGGLLTLGTASSVGSASLTAGDGIAFTQLTTTGRGADLVLDATGGGIAGPAATSAGALDATAAGSIAIATAASAGPQDWSAGTGLTATSITSTGADPRGGTITLAAAAGALDVGTAGAQAGSLAFSSGGALDVPTANAAGTIQASAGGTATIGTWTSGGSQTITAGQDVDFTRITTTGTNSDPGNVTITALLGAIRGGAISAHGSVSLDGNGIAFSTIDAGGDGTFVSSGVFSGQQVNVAGNLSIQGGTGGIALDGIDATTLSLSTPGNLTITSLTVFSAIDLAANTMTANLTQAPGATQPLMMTVTGYHGGIAQSANLTVDAPIGVDLDTLSADMVTFTTTARDVHIGTADVPGSLTLTTPDGTFLVDNASPDDPPQPAVQMYQPGGLFTLTQNGVVTTTDAYVIAYQPDYTVISIDFTNDHRDAAPDFVGSGSIRDSTWNMVDDLQAGQRTTQAAVPFPSPQVLFPGGVPTVSFSDTVPAVNLTEAGPADAPQN